MKMYVIVIKYVQLFCISVFFNNINCNEVFDVPNHDQHQVYQITDCVVQCINNNNQDLPHCYPDCAETINNLSDKNLKYQMKEYADLKLICRDSNTLILKISEKESNISNYEKNLYMIKIQEDEQANRERFIYLSDTKIIPVKNLRANTTFNLSAIVFKNNGEKLSTPIKQFKTLHSYYKPEKIKNLKIERIFSNQSELVNVKVTWNPGFDKTCLYDIVYHSQENQSFPFKTLRIEDPSVLYEYEIKNLTANHEYTVGIRALNTVNFSRESDFEWLEFNTSRCNAVNNLNLTLCPPDPVFGLRANITKLEKSDNEYAINVEWVEPIIYPDNYSIQIINYITKNVLKTFIVSGKETKFHTEFFLHYFVRPIILNMYSISLGGHSKPKYLVLFLDMKEHSEVQTIESNLWQKIIFVLLAAILTLLIGFLIYRYHKHRLENYRMQETDTVSQNRMHDYLITNYYDKQMSYWYSDCIKPIDDQFEISKTKIEILEKLGEGAFGMVKKGRLLFNGEIVAIKTLKENPSKSEIVEFRQEIELMKSVGKHKNIVRIIGHFTEDYKELMLLVEFCSRGNLLNFLRKTWKDMQNLSEDDNSRRGIFNKLYAKMPDKVPIDWDEGFVENLGYDVIDFENNVQFDGLLLLYFALQVAFGMEYLSKNKVVHRDLAARNVLVCEDLTLKISDFGLSRDVYQENFYRKTGSGKLPIKWLALESMTRQMYNMYTDVWSYGILLYEIFTLGNDPYPSIPTNNLLDALKSGHRLEKPINCSDALYKLMYNCWLENPNNRPDFTEIKQLLLCFIGEMRLGTEHIVLFDEKLNQSPSLITVEPYLKPMT